MQDVSNKQCVKENKHDAYACTLCGYNWPYRSMQMHIYLEHTGLWRYTWLISLQSGWLACTVADCPETHGNNETIPLDEWRAVILNSSPAVQELGFDSLLSLSMGEVCSHEPVLYVVISFFIFVSWNYLQLRNVYVTSDDRSSQSASCVRRTCSVRIQGARWLQQDFFWSISICPPNLTAWRRGTA